jgi:hypothetical protein
MNNTNNNNTTLEDEDNKYPWFKKSRESADRAKNFDFVNKVSDFANTSIESLTKRFRQSTPDQKPPNKIPTWSWQGIPINEHKKYITKNVKDIDNEIKYSKRWMYFNPEELMNNWGSRDAEQQFVSIFFFGIIANLSILGINATFIHTPNFLSRLTRFVTALPFVILNGMYLGVKFIFKGNKGNKFINCKVESKNYELVVDVNNTVLNGDDYNCFKAFFLIGKLTINMGTMNDYENNKKDLILVIEPQHQSLAGSENYFRNLIIKELSGLKSFNNEEIKKIYDIDILLLAVIESFKNFTIVLGSALKTFNNSISENPEEKENTLLENKEKTENSKTGGRKKSKKTKHLHRKKKHSKTRKNKN